MNFYESPLFVELLLDAIYLLLLVVVGLTCYSVLRSFFLRKGTLDDDCIPIRKIAWGVMVFLLFTLVMTALFADTTPLTINGRTFSDSFWLRMSDMLINTSCILILVAVVCMIADYIRRFLIR